MLLISKPFPPKFSKSPKKFFDASKNLADKNIFLLAVCRRQSPKFRVLITPNPVFWLGKSACRDTLMGLKGETKALNLKRKRHTILATILGYDFCPSSKIVDNTGLLDVRFPKLSCQYTSSRRQIADVSAKICYSKRS